MDLEAVASTAGEAEERFRLKAEQLAVRLRWLSIVTIPLLAHLSGQPVDSPGFELLILTAVAYNWIVARSLARGRRGATLSVGTAIQDSVYLTLLSYLSGGLDSAVVPFVYLAMISVCMRLSVPAVVVMAGIYSAELTLLAALEGAPALPINVAYVFLVAAFVVPLVREARVHLAEVLSGHSAQRGLLRRLLRLEEEERRRVASELHDRGGGALFSLLHGLRRLRELVHTEEVTADVDRLIGVVEESVQDLRTLITDLRPGLLDDLGLAEALRDLLARERALSGLSVSLELDTEELPEPQSALAFYRVTQEALTNIRRHAEARSVVVRLGQENGCWRLTIEDDGRGIRGPMSGLGLRTMKERVEALGGDFRVSDASAGGTRLTAEVPRREAGE